MEIVEEWCVTVLVYQLLVLSQFYEAGAYQKQGDVNTIVDIVSTHYLQYLHIVYTQDYQD